MSDRIETGWGHININVRDLDRSIAFYNSLGFETLIPGIPYLGLTAEAQSRICDPVCQLMGWAHGIKGRACIMQLGESFPKIDLIELSSPGHGSPAANDDRGLVRLCLSSQDLNADIARLEALGIRPVSGPSSAHDNLANVALITDPDGTLIELVQLHLEKWAPYLTQD